MDLFKPHSNCMQKPDWEVQCTEVWPWNVTSLYHLLLSYVFPHNCCLCTILTKWWLIHRLFGEFHSVHEGAAVQSRAHSLASEAFSHVHPIINILQLGNFPPTCSMKNNTGAAASSQKGTCQFYTAQENWNLLLKGPNTKNENNKILFMWEMPVHGRRSLLP